MRKLLKTIFRTALIVLLVAFIAVQFYPYGREHTNPPVTGEPKWDSPRTQEIFIRACADCHSNQTRWPWYSNVAPISWLIQRDVEKGRARFNVSEWGRLRNNGDEAAGEVEEGKMPLWFYLLLHPEAKFNDAERVEFIRGLRATFETEEMEEGNR